MAAELNAKAAEIDEENRQDRWPRALDRNPSSIAIADNPTALAAIFGAGISLN